MLIFSYYLCRYADEREYFKSDLEYQNYVEKLEDISTTIQQ